MSETPLGLIKVLRVFDAKPHNPWTRGLDQLSAWISPHGERMFWPECPQCMDVVHMGTAFHVYITQKFDFCLF